MIWGGIVLAVSVVDTFAKMFKADKFLEEAKEVNIACFHKVAAVNEEIYVKNRELQRTMKKVVNRKKGIINTSISDFLLLYGNIKKCNLLPSEGIKEFEEFNLTLNDVDELNKMKHIESLKLKTSQEVALFIFSGVGGIIKKEAEIELSAANIRLKQSSIAESQAQSALLILNESLLNMERTAMILRDLNVLFCASIEQNQLAVERNGSDKSKYSKNERENLMICCNMAKAIKDIIDIPLMNVNGKFSEQAKELLATGSQCLDLYTQCVSGGN
ncbi:hypothetical protein M2150_002851 [Lachnospiraceae bacterium PM6-15]|uniref:hypothetical protein n=1 Tax=Ohessyouella blattaphilus TaxID=2949333 RepID=UPI003E2ADB95